jgi:hypothetical protein
MANNCVLVSLIYFLCFSFSSSSSSSSSSSLLSSIEKTNVTYVPARQIIYRKRNSETKAVRHECLKDKETLKTQANRVWIVNRMKAKMKVEKKRKKKKTIVTITLTISHGFIVLFSCFALLFVFDFHFKSLTLKI